MKKILFVCSGNTCRSPLAEGIARKTLPRRIRTPVEVSSAGSSAFEGVPASQQAIEVARRHGIDLSGHRSRLLDGRRVREADLIVTMTGKHRDTVGAIDPDALAYTVMLTDFGGGGVDVPDPVGGGLAEYERTYDLIDRCVAEMAERLDGFDGWKPEGE